MEGVCDHPPHHTPGVPAEPVSVDHAPLTDWLGIAVEQVAADVAHSRALVGAAAQRLGDGFANLAVDPALAPHLHEVVAALQFEDLVSQLLASVLVKLEALRGVCAAAALDPAGAQVAALQSHAQTLLDHAIVATEGGGEIDLF